MTPAEDLGGPRWIGAQRGGNVAKTNPKQTSAKVAKAASKVLQSKASPAAKSAAGSALAQTRPSKKKK
ncbi:hypothetical protein HF526_00810 [Pseudonocardia sp. K10HN5]|uniref:Uncharacterized protein n=1 Tax=Pseudonocardia acidicola TaxID=2724939 RepID=A0ABX1S2U2_9PSEU|nr:hypothetical protein [Pseudonocardia acidicola]